MFRTLTPNLAVAPQISLEEVNDAAQQGFTRIINNRPDGEDVGQPTGAEIEAAAKALGVSRNTIYRKKDLLPPDLLR